MSKRLRNRLLKYGIFAVVCIAFVLFYCSVWDFFQMETVERYRTLCDAFTIPGLLALCVGVLLWASNDGLFYGLGYCLEITWRALIPGARRKMERYYDYVMRHKEKQITGYGFLFICGGICMGIALIFMALFYQLY